MYDIRSADLTLTKDINEIQPHRLGYGCPLPRFMSAKSLPNSATPAKPLSPENLPRLGAGFLSSSEWAI